MLRTCETPHTTNSQAPTRTAPPPPGWSKESCRSVCRTAAANPTTIAVDQRRIIIMQIKCYEGGPIVRIPALVADLKGFNVAMFIGLPGLRHMRAKLDLSDPDKMVLDTGRGGCRHTITVSATGKQQAMVEPTADQLPQPTRRLGLPPGHTSEGFVNAETQDGHDGVRRT
jgi:hypothetical protein